MPLTFTPLSPLFGARVEGVDLKAVQGAALREGLARWKVLSIHAPDAGPDGFLALARALGELEPFFLSAYSLKSHPEIYVLSNVRENGAPIGRDGAGFHWHSDHTFEERPCAATLLYGVECPAEGGDTLFVDMIDAHRRLPQATKDAIREKRAIHLYQKKEFAFTAEREVDAETAAKIKALKAERAAEEAVKPASATQKASKSRPPALHPIARRHPVTGETALYLNEEMTVGIEGMEDGAAQTLLRDLAVHATPEDRILRYKWRPGDIVIWDNAATMHSATYTDPALRRVMYRLTIKGERPEAEDAA